MTQFLTAIGIVLVLEGCAYILIPSTMKRLMGNILGQDDRGLRMIGFACAVVGLFIVWLVRL
ncbi:MAG: DUF2065 domain-containing protein [Pseudomonadota bacterium]